MITSVLVREPAGDRSMQLPLLIGSMSHCDIRVPGFVDDESVRLFAEGAAIYLEALTPTTALIDGQKLEQGAIRTVQTDSVLAIGDTRAVFSQETGSIALSIRHLEGNRTIAPLRSTSSVFDDHDQQDVPIKVTVASSAGMEMSSRVSMRSTRWATPPRRLARALPMAMCAMASGRHR